MSNQAEQPPRILYHYTTVEALIRIVESRSLWASKIQHLNDAKEFRHAMRVASNVIQKQMKSRGGHGTDFLSEMLERLEHLEEMDSFAASLSAKPDDLSQWRAYSNSGVGVAIGFNSAFLGAAARSSHFDLVKCSYSEDEQRGRMENLVQQAINDASGVSPELTLDGGRLTPVIATFLHHFSREACRMKSGFFEAEAEWRLVWRVHTGFENEETGLRISGSMLVPYKKVDLSSQLGKIDCIEEVILGPNPHSALNKRALDTYLFRGTSLPSGVIESKVPYRNW